MEKKFEYIQNITDKLLVKCYCPDEKRIVVEDGVTMIGPSAFFGSKTEEIVLPGSIKRIYDKAFMRCESLERIVIGRNNLEEIGDCVLNGCVNLQEISFASAFELEAEAFQVFSKACQVFSRLVNSCTRTYYFMNADKAVAKMKQVFTKRRRNMTLKISAGKKEIVIPRYVDTISKALLEKIAFNALLEGLDERTPKEDIAFDNNGWALNEFLSHNMNDAKCSFLTAMEFYFLEKDKSALQYLKSHVTEGCQILTTEKEDYLMAEFVKMDIMDEEELNYAMQVALDNGLTTAAAYILNSMDKKKKTKLKI